MGDGKVCIKISRKIQKKPFNGSYLLGLNHRVGAFVFDVLHYLNYLSNCMNHFCGGSDNSRIEKLSK